VQVENTDIIIIKIRLKYILFKKTGSRKKICKKCKDIKIVFQQVSYDHFVQYLVYQQNQVEDNIDVIKDFFHLIKHDSHGNLNTKIRIEDISLLFFFLN
jgi:hypothetical protein